MLDNDDTIEYKALQQEYKIIKPEEEVKKAEIIENFKGVFDKDILK